jgi:hypothetical protein
MSEEIKESSVGKAYISSGILTKYIQSLFTKSEGEGRLETFKLKYDIIKMNLNTVCLFIRHS